MCASSGTRDNNLSIKKKSQKLLNGAICFPGATKKKKNEACASFHYYWPDSSPHLMINDSLLSEKKDQFTPLHLKTL